MANLNANFILGIQSYKKKKMRGKRELFRASYGYFEIDLHERWKVSSPVETRSRPYSLFTKVFPELRRRRSRGRRGKGVGGGIVKVITTLATCRCFAVK